MLTFLFSIYIMQPGLNYVFIIVITPSGYNIRSCLHYSPQYLLEILLADSNRLQTTPSHLELFI